MDSDDYRCHSGGSSPPDPLARLSDYAAESSCSSWGSDESLSCTSLQIHNIPSPCFNYPSSEVNWQQRYAHLQAEMSRFRRQANRTREILREKVSSGAAPRWRAKKIVANWKVLLVTLMDWRAKAEKPLFARAYFLTLKLLIHVRDSVIDRKT